MFFDGRYNKVVSAVVAGMIGWATLVVNSASDTITASEWITGATYLAIALGVYGIANTGAVHAVQSNEVGVGVQGEEQEYGEDVFEEIPDQGQGASPNEGDVR
jgi:hypothetical protein